MTVVVPGSASVFLLLAAATSIGCATKPKQPPGGRTNCGREQGSGLSYAIPLPPGEDDFCRKPLLKFEQAWISLQRTECYGTCPAFQLTVFPDGRVFYAGKRFVMRKGAEQALLSSATVEQLKRAIVMSYFGTLESHCCDCTTTTDAPWTNLTVIDEGGAKSIRHYHGCATAAGAVDELEEAVINLTGAAKWIGTDDERARQHWTRDSE